MIDSILTFIKGIPIGFIFSFSLGPVFFALINISITHGFKSAMYIVLGVFLSDLLLISIAYSGVEMFLPATSNNIEFIVQIIGGILIIIMGLSSILKRKSKVYVEDDKPAHPLFNFSKGILLNILNPSNLIAWAFLVTNSKTTFKFDTNEGLIFLAGIIVGIVATQTGVAYSAGKLQKILNEKVRRRINIVTGLLLALSGVYLLIMAFTK